MGRIRAALGDGPAAVEIPRDYERALPPGVDILELFVERVSDYRATVHRTTARGPPRHDRDRAGGTRSGSGRRSGRAPARLAREEPSARPPSTIRRCRTRTSTPSMASSPAVRSRSPRPARSSSMRDRTRAVGRSACCRTSTSAWSCQARSSGPCPKPWRGSIRPGPRPGSAVRRPRATSNCSASKASTVRAPSTSCSSRTERLSSSGFRALSDYHPSHARRDARRRPDDHVVARAPDRDGSDAPQDASEMAPCAVGATVQGLRVPVPWHRWGIRAPLLARADAQ